MLLKATRAVTVWQGTPVAAVPQGDPRRHGVAGHSGGRGFCAGPAGRRPAMRQARGLTTTEETMTRIHRVLVCAVCLALSVALARLASAAPEGQLTFAVHVSLAPTWFDPAETPGVITPFMTLYALHDALVKPMPGHAWGA